MLRQRIITASIAIPCVVAAIWWLPIGILALLFGVLMLFAALEWAGLMGLKTPAARALYVVLMAVVLGVLWHLHDRTLVLECVLALSFAWWCFALVAVARYPRGALGHGSGLAQPSWSGVVKSGAAGVLVLGPAFMALVQLHQSGPRGPMWILVLLALVWAGDSGAYFVGRAAGRHKLAPAVSPGKTREGAFGGIASSVIITVLLGAGALGIGGAALAALVILAAGVSVFSIVGDLLESVFKRAAGVKDSGMLFPGHGGVLDRLDSLFAAAPLFVLGLMLARLE